MKAFEFFYGPGYTSNHVPDIKLDHFLSFALPGIGTLTVDAVSKRDIPVIQGTTLVFSLFVVVANLIIDVLYTLIDPRVRFEGVKS